MGVTGRSAAGSSEDAGGGSKAHHVVPGCDDRLHVEVRGEEGDDAVGHALAVLDQDRAEVADD